MARTLIGNIKGPKGDTGDTGATGATGAAGASASVSVGTVTALEYGNNPTVTNSGSAQNAVFNFGIPKGKPADNITELDNLPVNSSVTPSADFPVPAVGDTSKTILGKIIKWFGDMSALVATKFNAANVYNGLDKTESGYALDARQGKALNDTKLNAANVVNNLTTTSSGYALDARQGKVLNDAYTSLKSKMAMGGHSSHPQVPIGANLNSYIDTGTYVVLTDAIAQTITNMPRSASGTLYVLDQGASQYITQIYIPTTSATLIYVRTMSKTNFNEWRSFNTNSFGIDSFTDTTSVSGNLSHNFGKSVIILSAWSTIGDTIVQAYPKSGTTTSGTSLWWFHIRTASASSSAVTNQSVTVTALYMDV